MHSLFYIISIFINLLHLHNIYNFHLHIYSHYYKFHPIPLFLIYTLHTLNYRLIIDINFHLFICMIRLLLIHTHIYNSYNFNLDYILNTAKFFYLEFNNFLHYQHMNQCKYYNVFQNKINTFHLPMDINLINKNLLIKLSKSIFLSLNYNEINF